MDQGRGVNIAPAIERNIALVVPGTFGHGGDGKRNKRGRSALRWPRHQFTNMHSRPSTCAQWAFVHLPSHD
eukprot:12651085-Alexandrium_andersonii.AAC.1